MKYDSFIGREIEMRDFDLLLKKPTASLVVLKGRRRVGKSRLLAEFVRNKRAYKFVGLWPNDKTTDQIQRDVFMQALANQAGVPEVKVDDWTKLFDMLARETKTGRVIIVFDEISWMGSLDSDFLAKLKTAWDESFKKNPKLILVLCGSVSTWIDENIISNEAYYGRIDWTVTLNPLPLNDCSTLLKAQGFRGSAYEKFKILSVTGGIPWYIEQMQGGFTADDNIRRQAFTKGGVLFNDFDRIFKDIFGKRDAIYRRIVKALVAGKRTYQELAKKLNYTSSGRLSDYLNALVEAGFVSRNFTWDLKTKNESKNSEYRLSDNYVRFYLKCIFPKTSQIAKGRFLDSSISSLPGYDVIMGLQFENLVLSNRNKVLEILSLRFSDIDADNPYFQTKTTRQEGCQIDYLIQMSFGNIYVCEIRFSRNEIKTKAIHDVKEKISKLSLPKNTAVLPVLIHVNGVSDSVLDSNYFYKIINFSELLEDVKD